MFTKYSHLTTCWLKKGVSMLAILFASSSSANINPYNANIETPEVPTNRIIVKYKAQTEAFNNSSRVNQMQRINNVTGVQMKYLRAMSGNSHVLSLPGKHSPQQVKEISQQLMSLPEVEYAEPDTIMFPTMVPNDPRYPEQWSYFDTYGINLPKAWDITTGQASIVVAVIDTGITNHADLSGKILPGYDFISDTNFANDSNGRDNSPLDPGDWITSAESSNSSGPFYGCPVHDSSWHGTHVAGTIGANTNNSLGVAGINWHSKILPVRVLGKCGGYTSDIVDGMRWAAGIPVAGVSNNTSPAKVLNLSLGSSQTCSQIYQQAIDEIYDKGAIVVVAAGNSNTNASNFSPASCNKIITVAATDKNGNRAYYSNYGSVVEIAAPGGAQSSANDPNGILSTLNTGTKGPLADTYINFQGTSMAAPHISGIVSLILSNNPNLNFNQVLQLLQNKAKAFPAGSECLTRGCGSGIADTAASLGGTPSGEELTLTTRSVAANDGIVAESSENSSLGGMIYPSLYFIAMGDDASNRQYRSILSFNTAALPDNAVITKATIKIRTAGTMGTNPFTTHGPLLADIKKSSFGSSVGLEAADWQGSANLSNAATFSGTPANGWYSAKINSNGLPFINKSGVTQLRLRYTTGDNNDLGADYMGFYAGDTTTATYRPIFEIEYHLP
jgi:serine protease